MENFTHLVWAQRETNISTILRSFFVAASVVVTLSIFALQLLSPGLVIALIGFLLLITVPLFYTIAFPLIILYYQPLVNIQGLNVTLADLGILCISISILLMRRYPIDKVTTRVIYLLFVMALALPIFSAIGSAVTWGDTTNTLTAFLLYIKRFSEYALLLLVIPFVRTFRSMHPFIYVFVAGIIVATLSAVIPSLNDLLVSRVVNINFGERRVGVLLNPNVAGDFGLLFVNLGVALYVFGQGIIGYRWLYALLTLIPGALLMAVSGSRAIVIAALACGFFWLWKGLRNKRVFTIMAIALIAGSAYLAAYPDNPLSQRWSIFVSEGLGERNLADRVDSQTIGLSIYQKNPIFGIGAGTLDDISRQFGKYITGTDSQYVDTLIEAGIFGLFALLIVLGLFFYYGVVTGGVFGTTLAVNTLGMAVAGFSGYTFYNPFIASYMWFFFLVATLERHMRSEASLSESNINKQEFYREYADGSLRQDQ